MAKNNLLIIIDKNDPALKLKYFAGKKPGKFSFNKFSFLENEKVRAFYSEVDSLSKNNNANVVLVNEKGKYDLINAEFSFNKFSFLENEKVRAFYSEVYSLSKNNNANVVLVNEKGKYDLINAEFYSIPAVSPSNVSKLFEGRVKLDYTTKNFLFVEGCNNHDALALEK